MTVLCSSSFLRSKDRREEGDTMTDIHYAPTLIMVLVQVGFAGLNIVSKLALDSGMSPFVMIAYRQLIATLALAPIAFFLERKTCMKITGAVIFQIFLCSVFGATGNQLLYFMGLKHTTPTIGCALTNMLPAITFILAVPFRMEKVAIRTVAGKAKVIGTVLCVGGSMLMTFYKGSQVKVFQSPIHWKYVEDMDSGDGGDGGQNMILGALLVILSTVSQAVWFITQAKMSKTFNAPYTSSTIMCFMATLQCAAIGGSVERDLSKWKLGWDIGLGAVVYTGLVCSAVAVLIITWCIGKRGPLFVSMFTPLMLVIVAVIGWAILDEKLYIGSAIGSALIVGGLYMVLWGKGTEIMVADLGGKAIDEELGMEEINTSICLKLNSTPTHSEQEKQRGI